MLLAENDATFRDWRPAGKTLRTCRHVPMYLRTVSSSIAPRCLFSKPGIDKRRFIA